MAEDLSVAYIQNTVPKHIAVHMKLEALGTFYSSDITIDEAVNRI